MNIKFDKNKIDEIIDRYIVKKENLTKISKDYNVGPLTIKRHLLAHGIKIDSSRRNTWNTGLKLGPDYAWNKGLTKETHPSIRKANETYKKHLKQGLIKHGLPTPEREILRRKKISDSINRRYADGWLPKAGRCKKIRYNSPFAGSVLLDGTWEVEFAKYADKHKIVWKRNKTRFSYFFDNKDRYYTPDFYLTDLNLYVEVKGYITEKDIAKWEQFPQKLTVILKEQISLIKQDRILILEDEPARRTGGVC